MIAQDRSITLKAILDAPVAALYDSHGTNVLKRRGAAGAAESARLDSTSSKQATQRLLLALNYRPQCRSFLAHAVIGTHC